jgi:hypothetical protein
VTVALRKTNDSSEVEDVNVGSQIFLCSSVHL